MSHRLASSFALAPILALLGTGDAYAESGLIERRLATPTVEKVAAVLTDDGHLEVRVETVEPPWVHDLRSESLRRSAFSALAWLPGGDQNRYLEKRLGRSEDDFQAVVTHRFLPGLWLFLDAPPSLTGDETVEPGRRVEPNRVDTYFLADDCVSVGVHGSVGRLWTDFYYCLNVYSIFGLEDRKLVIERSILARREPHRFVARLAFALERDRQLELFLEGAWESPLDKSRERPGARGGIRGWF
jgi:hypothetical protein